MSDFDEHEFTYYFFENFDASQEANNIYNPRNITDHNLDAVLSELINCEPGTITLKDMTNRYGEEFISRVITAGVMRVEANAAFIDTPIFSSNDIGLLQEYFSEKASKLVTMLLSHQNEIYRLAMKIDNGFSPAVNLFHILCGMCFDGLFLEKLGERDCISTGRDHKSGLNYLMVIYENSPLFSAFSDGLLCSYNRITNEHCALESFGDAAGNRCDPYRYFRLREQGNLSAEYSRIHALTQELTEDDLLNAIYDLAKGQMAKDKPMKALEAFGYVSDGAICVPVYQSDDDGNIREIEHCLEEILLDHVTEVLYGVKERNITAARHGVPIKEIANECWHILFGSINEKLVQSSFVAAPKGSKSEGRYLQAIEIF